MANRRGVFEFRMRLQDQATCGQYGVQGYPTIKVFAANKKRPQAYNGERSAAAIVQHATQVGLEHRFVPFSVSVG